MKKPLILLFLVIFSASNSFAQSKKEQIKQLNYRVDSLIQILSSERINLKKEKYVLEQQKDSLEQQIVELTNTITKLKVQAESVNKSVKAYDAALSKALSEKGQLTNALKQKNDSLNLVLADLEKLKPPVKIAPGNVTIGTQVWTTKNLDVATFRNGDAIPEAKTNEEWEAAGNNKQPAWCYYENNTTNGTKYGKLYNWYAVNDARGLAPTGYHIPTDDEWTVLSTYLGVVVAGKKMKSSSGWNDAGNGNNSSGFSGLPGGERFPKGYFYYVGTSGTWWSASDSNVTEAWYRSLDNEKSILYRANPYKSDGFSVRCVKD